MTLCVLWLAALGVLQPESGVSILEGHVTDLWNGPLPGVTVMLDFGKGRSVAIVSGGGGEFELRGVLPGRHRVTFSMKGFVTRTTEIAFANHDRSSVTMVLAAEEPDGVYLCNCDPIMDEPRPEATVKSRVVWVTDTAGTPVPGAMVSLVGRGVAVITDLHGRACLLAPWRQRLKVTDLYFKSRDTDLCCLPLDGRIILHP